MLEICSFITSLSGASKVVRSTIQPKKQNKKKSSECVSWRRQGRGVWTKFEKKGWGRQYRGVFIYGQA